MKIYHVNPTCTDAARCEPRGEYGPVTMKPTRKQLNKADWVCWECGEHYGSTIPSAAAFHEETCGVCGKLRPCTQPRDFGYLKEVHV